MSLPELLAGLGQEHLLGPTIALTSEEKELMVADIQEFNAGTYSGGFQKYVTSAQALLVAAEKGESYLSGCQVDIPQAVVKIPQLGRNTKIKHSSNTSTPCDDDQPDGVTYTDTKSGVSTSVGCSSAMGQTIIKEYAAMEAKGFDILSEGGAVFVLVAGGLGERLGYQDIKLSLPIETATGVSYLEHYCSWIHQLGLRGAHLSSEYQKGEKPGTQRRRSSKLRRPPHLVLMTSRDTHDKTLTLLKSIQFGGLDPITQVTLIRQESVFALENGKAQLAVSGGSPRRLLKKPHGHGDVHALLSQQAELLHQWSTEGYHHIIFIQDTNAASTLTLPLSVAYMRGDGEGEEEEEGDLKPESEGGQQCLMSFTCVPRLGSEAVGNLCDVTFPEKEEGSSGNPKPRVVTMNVEYNLFDGLYKETCKARMKKGTDQPPAAPVGPDGFSLFPGSINTLLVSFPQYMAALTEHKGAIPEFVNPKYQSDGVTFKSPARLECLMQDIAMLLHDTPCSSTSKSGGRIQGVVFPRKMYAPVKNSTSEALAKIGKGMEAHSAGPGEATVYEHHRQHFRALGCQIGYADDDSSTSSSSLFYGIYCELFPIIAADAQFGNCLSRLIQSDRLGGTATSSSSSSSPGSVKVSGRSALVLKGNVQINSLDLDGALVVDGSDQSAATPLLPPPRLVLDQVTVKNKGWIAVKVEDWDECRVEGGRLSGVDLVRGFRLHRCETTTLKLSALLKATLTAPTGTSVIVEGFAVTSTVGAAGEAVVTVSNSESTITSNL